MPAISGPLTGIKVIALEQAVAAPYCTSRLADAGAEIIKIERPEGDFARGYDQAANGLSSYFVWLNRGKTSKIVDLKSKTGKQQLKALLNEADILVQNLKPGALESLGFSIETLRQEYPRLITCSISGYGEDGPFKKRKAYDLLIQAEAGLCSVTGGPESPSRVGASVVDIATGATAHSAILEALIQRGITGEGDDITISMFDVMADWMTVPLLNHEAGNSPKRMGMAHPSIAPYGVFKTLDDKQILISIQSDREWRILAEVFLQKPALADDPRFASNLARVENRQATDRIVAERFLKYFHEDALQLLAEAELAFATVNDMEGLSKHPHLRRITVETENGPVQHPAPAALFKKGDRDYGPIPALAE